MIRRSFLTSVGSAMIFLSGCEDAPDEPSSTLEVYPRVSKRADGWRITVRVRNVRNYDVGFQDVSVVAYGEEGSLVCKKGIGDFVPPGDYDREAVLDCTKPPYLITTVAEQSPCSDSHDFEIVRRMQVEAQSEQWEWDRFTRQCDESLPPDRLFRETQRE